MSILTQMVLIEKYGLRAATRLQTQNALRYELRAFSG